MGFRTEAARAQDLDAGLELLRRAGLPDTGVAEGFSDFLAVRDGTRLVGLCGLEVHGKDGLLRSLVVDPQYRGEGVGAALVDGTMARARERGVSRVYLLTTTARDYFLRRGFRDCPREDAPTAIQESWEFKSGCPSTSAFMRIAVG
jgi:N-acetylglutamate synthase-like GNAT family acetyltransferase